MLINCNRISSIVLITFLLNFIVQSYQESPFKSCPTAQPYGCLCELVTSNPEETETDSSNTDIIMHVTCVKLNFTIFPYTLINPRHLTISENSIEIVDKPLPYVNLTALYLHNNKIRYIKSDSFKNLLHLNILDLSHNEIGNINHDTFTGLSSLHHLILNHNHLNYIGSLTFSRLHSLIFLEMEACRIMNIQPDTFEKLNELQKLNLAFNQLVKLERLGAMRQLSILNISGNTIHDLDGSVFDNLPNLWDLDLRSNRLLHITNMRYTNRSLSSLNLRDNELKELESLELYSLHNLTHLDLSYNHFSVLDRELFPEELIADKKAINKKLFLEENYLDCLTCDNYWVATNVLIIESNENMPKCKQRDENENFKTLRGGMEHCVASKSSRASQVLLITFFFLASVAVIMLIVVVVRRRKRKRSHANQSVLSHEVAYREMDDNAPFTIDDYNDNANKFEDRTT